MLTHAPPTHSSPFDPHQFGQEIVSDLMHALWEIWRDESLLKLPSGFIASVLASVSLAVVSEKSEPSILPRKGVKQPPEHVIGQLQVFLKKRAHLNN